MKIKKLILCTLIIILLSGCTLFDDCKTIDEITQYVNAEYESLDSILTIDPKLYQEDEIIQEYLGEKSIVKSIYRYDEEHIDFYCGGCGNATNSVYTGFYFSKKDEPYALEFESDCVFAESEPGKFSWNNADKTHEFYTQRIRENWFYYYMVWN